MSDSAPLSSSWAGDSIRPILIGGIIAGTLDAGTAFYTFGWGMPRGIASGLLGRSALQGGPGTWILGLALHYFIALSAAAVYYVVSRTLTFLRDYPVICGIFFGIAVFLVMNLVVLPLSAFHFRGPYQYAGLVQGILIHMFFVGVPIALSVRKYSRE
jgi:hypothetical protein